MASEDVSTTNAAGLSETSVPASSGTGISFSFSKRSQQSGVGGSRDKGESRVGGRGSKEKEEEDKDLVFSLEGGNIHSSKPVAKKKEYVIPLIRKVVWRGVSEGEKRGGETGSEGGGGSDGVSTNHLEKSEAELSLDREAAKAIVTDLKNQKSQSEAVDEGPVIPLLLQNKPPVNEDTQEGGELADLHMRPEPSTDEDYAEMPISEFGKAMLRGMGWNEGKAIGKTNKGMVAPVEFIPRMGKLGLGAAPKPQTMPDKKRPRKPGETDKKVQGPYIGADGRVKHTRLIGEELPEQPIEGFSPGNFARVLSGPHLGLCGKIVSADEDNSRVCLRLAINGQTIDFSQHRLELISKDEYRKPPAKPSNTKEYGLIKKGVRDQSSPTSQGLSGSEPSTSKILEQPSSDDTSRGSRDKKRHAEHVDLNFENAKRSKRSKDMHRSQRDSPSAASLSEGNSHHHKRSSRERLWVAPSLRVRIIDTKFKGGKYYNSKVTILDVVSGDQCVCQTAEGRHLEGVHQSMLETVVPKTHNAAVMMVGGKKHRGQIGTLLDRDSKNCKATIEVVHSGKIVTVDYDNVCEYTGDIDDL